MTNYVYVHPTAEGYYTTGTLITAPTKVEAVDPTGTITGAAGTWENAGGGSPANWRIEIIGGGSADVQSFRFSALRPELSSLTEMRVGLSWSCYDGGGGSPGEFYFFMRMDGVDATNPTIFYGQSGTSPSLYTQGWYVLGSNTGAGELERPGGGTWTLADYYNRTLELCFKEKNFVQYDGTVTVVCLRAEGVVVPSGRGQAVEIGSRRLVALQNRLFVPKYVLGPEGLDLDVGHEVAITDPNMPSADGTGSGTLDWQRRPMTVESMTIDHDAKTVEFLLLDGRLQAEGLWDTAYSERDGIALSDGIARHDVGATRTFARASKAWIESPVDGRVVEIQDDVEKNDYNGLLIEEARTNHQLYSSFKDGTGGGTPTFTGWTDGSSGGGALAEDLLDLLFDSTVVPRSLKLVGGAGTALATGTATAAFAASDVVCLSVDYKSDSGHAFGWKLYRSSGHWWRDSDATWQGSETWNSFTASMIKTRGISKPVTVDAYTLQLALRAQTGETHHAYHTQIERNATLAVGKFATSRILTGAATYTREADDYSISNEHGRYFWLPDVGSFRCEFLPAWGAYTELGQNATLIECRWNGTVDLDRLLIPSGTGLLTYRKAIASTNYDAADASTFPTGRLTKHTIAARWAGSRGEHGLSPWQFELYLDGVKVGTSSAAPASIACPAAVSPFGFGARPGATQVMNGWFRHVRFWPYCLSAEELK